jgi:hypothetical protein
MALEDTFDEPLDSNSERSGGLQNVAQRMLGKQVGRHLVNEQCTQCDISMEIGVDGIFATLKGAIDAAREIMGDATAVAYGKSLV